MPSQSLIRAFNGSGGQYVQLATSPIGEVGVLVRFNQDVYLITDPSVTTAGEAASAESTKGCFIKGNIDPLHSIRVDPCKTWIRAFGATGGNAFILFQY